MSRFLLAGLVALSGISWLPAQESESPQAEGTEQDDSARKQAVLDNPDDLDALRSYLTPQFRSLNTMLLEDPDKAETQLKDVQKFLASVTPKDEPAKKLLMSGLASLKSVQFRIDLARMPMEKVVAALDKNPDDVISLRNYSSKLSMQISPIARKEPENAGKLLAEGQDYLNALSTKAKKEATKTAIENALTSLGRLERTIENAKQHLALVGSDAAKLEVEGWVNGNPLTEDDLKGKVVLLDFWAVWCGPCLVTFPHLKAWDQKYDDLVIIGVTRYYNRVWDAETKKAKTGDGAVPPEAEQEMLVEFARHHQLTHRFALQLEKKLSEHYFVMGIPQAVLIDKAGKVRLIRVGSGEANAKDIEAMIEKLIAE